MTPRTRRLRRRRRTSRTPARHCCRFRHLELRTRLHVLEAIFGSDGRCDFRTGASGSGSGRVGGEDGGVGFRDDLEGW